MQKSLSHMINEIETSSNSYSFDFSHGTSAENSVFWQRGITTTELIMINSNFENTEDDQNMGLKLLESHRYWSMKRILFNIIVGVAGLISVILFLASDTTLFDLFGMIAWGVVANGLYSTGYILDSYIIIDSKGERSLGDNRRILFWIGTIAYVIVGFWFVMMYSFPVPD